MTLESRIEQRAVLELAKMGIPAIKHGKDGWPDRIVLYAPDRCLWLEFKKPKSGVISQKQKIRAKDLLAVRHKVFYPTTWQEAVDIVKNARAKVMK